MRQKKVGILTFHRAENFGAVLQAFALQTFLQRRGCDVRIIDYRNSAVEMMYHIFNPAVLLSRKNIVKSLALYLSRLRNVSVRRACKEKFSRFRSENFRLTPQCHDIAEVAGDFDSIIAGSDQIWNLHLTGGLDRNYFLDYKKRPGARKIAYAASSEVDPKNLMSSRKDVLSRLLDDFDAISVREEFLREEISQYTGNAVSICADPTFLLDEIEYGQIARRPAEKNYILIYHMTPIPEAGTLAEKLMGADTGPVIEIHAGCAGNRDDERHKYSLGPLEILGYIMYADAVITTSFHGLALALICRKNVWVVNRGSNLRQRNLLHALGLDGRMLNSVDEFEDSEIDYGTVSGKLSELTRSSVMFLHKAIFE